MQAKHRRGEGAPRRSAEEGVCKTFFVDEKRCAVVEARMLDGDAVDRIAEAFAALANPTRVRIVLALSIEELCVCDLARVVGRSVPATSQQLRLLRNSGIVKYRMDGKLAYYRLSSPWARKLVHDTSSRVNGKRRR